jgi:hypothetical protein
VNTGIKDMFAQKSGSKGCVTANHAKYANRTEINSSFRVVRLFHGQDLLLGKLEKNRGGVVDCLYFSLNLVPITKRARPFHSSAKAKQKNVKCEKYEKPVLPTFQLEPALAQFVPTKSRRWRFSDFSKIFRGYGGGAGKCQTLKAKIMKDKHSPKFA